MQTPFFCFLLRKAIVDKSVGYFFYIRLSMLFFQENIHLPILLLRLPMLLKLSKYAEFCEHKNWE